MNGVRRGFTLVEVAVAVAIAGIIALIVRGANDSLASQSQRLQRSIVARDGDHNRLRELRRLVASARSPHDSLTWFTGSTDSVSFASGCPTVEAWLVPCRISLRVTADGRLELLTATAGPTVLRDEVKGFAFLATAGNGGVWTVAWTSRVSLPLALGVVLPTDTLILPIGRRG